MTMIADPPTRGTSAPPSSGSQRLRTQFAAARVSFTWLGVRKALSSEQKEQAAEGFGAEGAFLSAGKKLLDTRHSKFRAVTAVRSRVSSYWRAMSLPYPEPGIRLIKQEAIEPFANQLAQFKADLETAVGELDRQYADLQVLARQRLGSLYNPDDYPASLVGLFDVAWEFPSVEPPEYLLRLNPQLYQQERQRLTARFEEAARLAEEAFAAEFSKLVSHLVDRLTPGIDGQAKVFRDTAVVNLSQFFDRFKSLNVGSGGQLEHLIATAKKAIGGTGPGAVRQNSTLRQAIASQLSTVQVSLDQLLVDQPRRRILRAVREGRGS